MQPTIVFWLIATVVEGVASTDFNGLVGHHLTIFTEVIGVIINISKLISCLFTIAKEVDLLTINRLQAGYGLTVFVNVDPASIVSVILS